MEQERYVDRLAGYLTRADALLHMVRAHGELLPAEVLAAAAALEAESDAWPEWDIGSMVFNVTAPGPLPWALPATLECSAPTDKDFLVSTVVFGDESIEVDALSPGSLKVFASGSGHVRCWCVLHPREKLTLRIKHRDPGFVLRRLPAVSGYPLGRAAHEL